MPNTLLTNIVEPRYFLQYIVERTAALSALWQSGIVQQTDQFNMLVDGGGRTVDMPFWQDLSGDDEVLSESVALSENNIAALQDVAVAQERGKNWGVQDLAAIHSGDDPVRVIGDLFATFWARAYQRTLISELKGIFATAGMAGNRNNIALGIAGTPLAANTLTGTSFLDSAQKLGDAKDRLTAILMHSAVENYLAKQNLITFIPQSLGQPSIELFMGKRVIVDDSLTPTVVNANNEYQTYLFGEGAFGYGESTRERPAPGAPEGSDWYFEYERNGKSGITNLMQRRRRVLHPRGVKWLGATVTGSSPLNSELELSANWLRVYEAKNVRIVQINHNIL